MIMPRFVMGEGMDYSGKGTIIDACKNYGKTQGFVFDLRGFTDLDLALQRFGNLDLSKVYGIISSEPTNWGIGQSIRQVLINKTSKGTKLGNYDVQSVINAYALDRLVLYNEFIVPALDADCWVFQERGWPSSIAYQISMSNQLNWPKDMNTILKVPGNSFALKYLPGLMMLPIISEQDFQKRFDAGRVKQDDAIFEEIGFQKKVKSIYESGIFTNYVEGMGVEIQFIDSALFPKQEDTYNEAQRILKHYIKKMIN